jgi:hypothetical protein
MGMLPQDYLEETIMELRRLKDLAEKAVAQISDGDFFATLDPESNSIAVIVKHMAGNMRSRWTDFLTSDGEKPDRNRDGEFVIEVRDSKEGLLKRWEMGWSCLFEAITPLKPEDLDRTVQIRGKPLSVLQAINRQISHYAYHVGQIVFLAKHFAGERWQSLSVPRKK